jgi:phospholipase C
VGDNILTLLKHNHTSYNVYEEGGLGSVSFLMDLDRDALGAPVPPRTLADFTADAEHGTLPAFSFVGASTGELHGISPKLGPAEDDGHPPSDVRNTEAFLYKVVQALMSNEQAFQKTVLFITFDENGGLYDHVVPPYACAPDTTTACYDYDFDRYGLRVPLIVVSPYLVRQGYVSHFVADHSSITRFLEHWLDLPALSKRDANAWPLLDFFDFGRTPFQVTLPAAPVAHGSCK